MPLPLIPAIIAIAATSAVGIGAGAKGYKDKKKSDELNEDAKKTVTHAESLLKRNRTATQESLEALGALKIQLWSSQVNDFGKYYSLIRNVDQELPQGENAVFASLSDVELQNTMKTASSFAEVANIGITSLGTGVLAGIGAYSGVMLLGAASTGTAISTLTGVAATNATLAWLGGGTLAAGGLGMAGGVAILGGIVAAPVLAVAGTLFAINSKNMLSQAHQNLAKAHEIKAEMEKACRQLEDICNASELCRLFLGGMKKYSDMAVLVVQRIIKDNGIDFATYSKDEQDKLRHVCGVIRILKEALNTVIMTEDGTLSPDALSKIAALNEQSVLMQEHFDTVYKLSEEEFEFLKDNLISTLDRYGIGLTGTFEALKTQQNWNAVYSKLAQKEINDVDKRILALIRKHMEYLQWMEFLAA